MLIEKYRNVNMVAILVNMESRIDRQCAGGFHPGSLRGALGPCPNPGEHVKVILECIKEITDAKKD